MRLSVYLKAGLCLGLISSTVQANTITQTFTSPNGIVEECRILPPMLDAKYEKDDLEDERLLCSLDFYATSLALCPKTWSTSPGTMIYDISHLNTTQAAYEDAEACGGNKKGHEKITKFKQTMNASGTSGTYSPASLMYYHLSRYFDTTVKVPVAVYRSMDVQTHFERVTKKAHTKNMGKGKMNRAGWKALYTAEKTPGNYRPPEELFTDDLKQIFGFLGDGGGERYGAEINGVRSSWGEVQNKEFQQTPAFTALRSDKTLLVAIEEGLASARSNSDIRKAMGPGASNFQMMVWMKELTEITLLDYIFNQQDRVGNIDYKWYVYYLDEEGKVKSDKLDNEELRSEMDKIDYPRRGQPGVELVQRTRINDNDAGGKTEYANFTKSTKMLEKIRHLAPETYKKLMVLDKDLQAKGTYFQYLKANFGLSEAQLNKIVANTHEAAEIYRDSCRQGRLRFDLASVKTAFAGEVREVQLNCEAP